MSRKIKFHTFQLLFRLFAYLADTTGGWRIFVLPKLLLGTLIVGLGLAPNENIKAQNSNSKHSDKKVVEEKNNTIKTNRKDTNKIDEVEENVFCYVIEQMPVYPNGEAELLRFISKNLKYPEDAIQKRIEGKVICRFLVNTDGSISDIKVLRSLSPSQDNEAIRVLKLLPKWIPGTQNGKTVRVYYTLPITFKLSK